MEMKDFFPVWERLSPAQQERLQGCATKRTVQRGSVIHSGGLDCAGLFLVEQGQLRAYILSDEGREITLYRLLDRDVCLFSASCILRSIQFEVMLQAERDTTVWVLPSEAYKGVMEESAALANFTNEIMANRFSDVMWLLEQILWKRFDQRLAGFLLEESALEESALEGSAQLNITHEAIGRHMGNPREVVTRMLRYFQGEGLIRLSRGAVEIIDAERLERLSHT